MKGSLIGLSLLPCFFIQAASATTPYDVAIASAKQLESKELEILLSQPAAALPANARAMEILSSNQMALELFRHAAEASNDGTLFAPKPKKMNSKTPIPRYSEHLKLFRLLMLDAKDKMACRQPRLAEKDLLAATGFIAQLSEQKYGEMFAALMQQLCLQMACDSYYASLRGVLPSVIYLKELAERLERVKRNQDFLRSVFLEQAEMTKGACREGVNPEAVARAREKLPFWIGMLVQKDHDPEFLSMIYSRLDTAVDEQKNAYIEAIRGNDPERIVSFNKKRAQEIRFRDQARKQQTPWKLVMDRMAGGTQTKRIMADFIVDGLLSIPPPPYEQQVSRYHVFLGELDVLRTGLAVKLYQRSRKRLPDDLEQLVPLLLPAVPQDSFDGFNALRYVKTGNKFRVYSLGPDGKDSQGSSALDWKAFMDNASRNSGDIVFSN